MSRLFGTDGVRGTWGEYPLDRDTITRLGAAVTAHLRAGGAGAAPRLVLGGDTRRSTPALARWFGAGAASAGATMSDLGVVPTPAVALAVRQLEADGGVVVSASHNPYPDNGIKLFDRHGFKWSEEEELALERRLAAQPKVDAADQPAAPALPGFTARYGDWLLDAAAPAGLAGLRIAIDCANGAASALGSSLLRRAGAEVVAAFDQPDGENINRGCGATEPAALQRLTVEHGCRLGVALDGDADRAVFCDERGGLRDGDAVLYLWANQAHERGELVPSEIVVTSMSNLGLARALARRGIACRRCEVGDRAVVATLRQAGLRLGGEPSGHVVDLLASTTGDGLFTALRTAALLAGTGAALSELLGELPRYPQVLANVRIRQRVPIDELAEVAALRDEVARALGDDGRLVLRYSGTEPLLRIMIEGGDQAQIEAFAQRLAAAVARTVG